MTATVFTFMHLPLLASFGTVGASIKVILSEPGMQHNAIADWMFGSSIATILISIVLISRIMEKDEETLSFTRPVSRILIAVSVMMIITSLLAGFLNTIVFLLLIMLLLLVPVYIGTVWWIHYKLFSQKEQEGNGTTN